MVEVWPRLPPYSTTVLWNFSMMEKYYEGMIIQVYIIFCDYNLVSLKIMWLPWFTVNKLELYFYKFGKVWTVATRKYCKSKYLLACFQNFKINNSQNIIPFNKKCILSHVYNSKCHCKQLRNLSSSLYYSYTWTQALEIPYLLSQVLWLLQIFFNYNWSRISPLSGNNEQVILAQICKLKLEVM